VELLTGDRIALLRPITRHSDGGSSRSSLDAVGAEEGCRCYSGLCHAVVLITAWRLADAVPIGAGECGEGVYHSSGFI